MITGVGGWLGALIIGLLLYYLGPLAPHPIGHILRVVGIVFLVVAVVLLILWLVTLLTGAAVIGAAVLL